MEKWLQGTARFPWACGELPQATPSGISPIMFIPFLHFFNLNQISEHKRYGVLSSSST
ncbi:hypothetical protein HBHAL_4779 [Halobacillus halophilus DSM 2266]|uniref:Uncharacterized protein n=1 Tax=Halobacillus halophilus (strain ATCC 35676 / DSM 2266 / JCM 20832 / KCTC 3685 / LMG 17431 / NBRC 102448 / NCIMB 2269) TaxID=866895 RepID=I0JSJ5_HALH3|nr:hypothetical protein HBHAL_4779 [Halobacillus halophilus DSM 2266]